MPCGDPDCGIRKALWLIRTDVERPYGDRWQAHRTNPGWWCAMHARDLTRVLNTYERKKQGLVPLDVWLRFIGR